MSALNLGFRALVLPISAAAVAVFAVPAIAAPAVVKPDKAGTCAACHGEVGVSASGAFPTIAGQYANYLEQSLKAYRDGTRKNAIMAAQAVNLTDDEIKQLSLWYAAQQGPLYTPSARGALKP